MRQPTPIAAILLGAVALAGVVTWWLPRDADPAAAVVPVVESGAARAGASEDQPTPQASTPASHVPLPPLEEADDGLNAEDLWAHIGDPRNSDLPPRLFASLAKLGAEVVRADATGVHRGRWPGYWATDARAEPCCRKMTVHSSGAAKDPLSPDVVRVTVAWSAKDLGHVGARVTTVVLRRISSGWEPIRD